MADLENAGSLVGALRQTNLNLLPVLRAVLRHRNLTRAAEELNLTQSAVSNSLRQLRSQFGDPLLVRDGRQLVLTRKAASLVQPLEQAMRAVQAVLAEETFDPRHSTRRFRIATADYVTAITLPRLAALLTGEAPGVRVQTLTTRPHAFEDLKLETIDLVIAPRDFIDAALLFEPDETQDISDERLCREPFVCIGRADDDALRTGMSREDYLKRAHAGFCLDLEFHGSLERAFLRDAHLEQFDRILTSNFMMLPFIVASSGCLALIPRSLAVQAMRTLPLRMIDPPIPVPELDLTMIWLRRRDGEPEMKWLRSVLHRCLDIGA